ncbi:hypothetical protein [Dankookia rubra]|nr:hypothetical protein [Dankookia rubra]
MRLRILKFFSTAQIVFRPLMPRSWQEAFYAVRTLNEIVLMVCLLSANT